MLIEIGDDFVLCSEEPPKQSARVCPDCGIVLEPGSADCPACYLALMTADSSHLLAQNGFAQNGGKKGPVPEADRPANRQAGVEQAPILRSGE